MPALRERREDIPLLVRHFVHKYSVRMNKKIESISRETMLSLTEQNWPGNIRELENFIERSVILTKDSVLYVPLGELEQEGTAGQAIWKRRSGNILFGCCASATG